MVNRVSVFVCMRLSCAHGHVRIQYANVVMVVVSLCCDDGGDIYKSRPHRVPRLAVLYAFTGRVYMDCSITKFAIDDGAVMMMNFFFVR